MSSENVTVMGNNVLVGTGLKGVVVDRRTMGAKVSTVVAGVWDGGGGVGGE